MFVSITNLQNLLTQTIIISVNKTTLYILHTQIKLFLIYFTYTIV